MQKNKDSQQKPLKLEIAPENDNGHVYWSKKRGYIYFLSKSGQVAFSIQEGFRKQYTLGCVELDMTHFEGADRYQKLFSPVNLAGKQGTSHAL